MHPWHEVDVGDQAPNVVNAIIEIPKGDMKMKVATTAIGGLELSLIPAAIGMVAQEQPGKIAPTPAAEKSPRSQFFWLNTRRDRRSGTNAESAAPATAPIRKYGSTVIKR